MKTSFALISVALLSAASLVAQIPFEPAGIARLNGWSYLPGKTFVFNPADTSVWMPQQNRFILGSQWGTAERSVNRRLWMNTANDKFSYRIFADTMALKAATTGVGPIAVSFASEDILGNHFGMAMQWDPEASLPDGGGYWNASPDDTLGACFGFYRKRGGYFASGDASRYVLTTDSASGSGDTGIVALAGIDYYPDVMRWQSSNTLLNGTRWYLAVNLRRANGLWDDSTAANDTALTIRMPYHTRRQDISIIYNPDSNRYDTIITYPKVYKSVRFDSVSVLTTGGGGVRTDAAYFANGRWLDTKLTATTDSVFVIRRRMLPKYSDTSDITLAAFFSAATIASANFGDSINRPFHLHGSAPAVGEVDSFDIEVRYHGKCDIAVNWVRLETPMARLVFREQRDSLIAMDYMKDVDSIMRRIRGHLPSARLWRIYGQDETPPPLQLFHRYLTFLFDRYLISEGPCYNRYRHAVPQRTYWGGAFRPQTQQLSSYLTKIWTGSTNVYDGIALGLYGGHRRDGEYLGSNYDDGLPEWKRTFDTAGKANALSFLYLTVLDGCAYERSRNQNFIYDDKPWSVNVYIMQQWRVKNFGGKPALVNEYERPQTGEEYRSTMWTNLLYGAKGFLYDRFVFDPLKDTTGQTDSALYTNNVK